MTTKVIFNSTTLLKKQAAQKARLNGLTLSTILNNAMRAYIEDRIDFDLFERDLAHARIEKKAGKGISSHLLMKKIGL